MESLEAKCDAGEADVYLSETMPAVEGMFHILRKFNSEKLRAIVELINGPIVGRRELEERKAKIEAHRTAREVVAGSVIQIAFHAINQFSFQAEKPASVLAFEEQLNAMIQNPPLGKVPQIKSSFQFPEKFCVGRQVGGMPAGLIIYAARNQYNHAGGGYLNPQTKLVFNYLHTLRPDPPNGLSFDIYDGSHYYAYSALCALGWVDSHRDEGSRTASSAYVLDMQALFGLERGFHERHPVIPPDQR